MCVCVCVCVCVRVCVCVCVERERESAHERERTDAGEREGPHLRAAVRSVHGHLGGKHVALEGSRKGRDSLC